MGKVILEFDSVEEQTEIKEALDGYKWKLSMWNLDQELRTIVKNGYYKDQIASKDEINLAEDIRELIREIINSYNLNLNE